MEPGNTFSNRLQRSIQILISGFQKNGRYLTTIILVFLSFTVSAKDFFGPANKEYHHWANGGTVKPDHEWINGALQKTNSTYNEGDIVPHVYTPDTKNWSSGPKTITVYYDYAHTGSSTIGGFFAFIDHFTPPDGYNGGAFALAGDLYASGNISNVTVTVLTNVSSGGQIYSRRKIDFTYTGGSGDPAAIYFGLQLAKQTDDPSFYDLGSADWPGASLQTSLEGDGSRTLSINLSTPVTCTTIDATIGGGVPVCINGTEPTITFTALNGTPPFTFEYTINNGPSQFISTNPGEFTATLTAPTGTSGVFEYHLISVAGQFCENEVDESTTVTVNPKPTAKIEVSDPVCDGGTVTVTFTGLVGTPPFLFAYTIDGTQQSPIQSNNSGVATITVSAVGSHTYALTGVSDANCSNDAAGSVTATVNPKPTAKIEVSDPVCDGGTVTVTFTGLVGTAPFLFAYSIDGTQQSPIQSNNSGVATITVSAVGSHTYALTGVSDANCSNDATGSVMTTIYEKPSASMEIGSSSVCKGDVLEITFTGSGGTKPYTFHYTDPDGNAQEVTTTGTSSTANITVPTSTPGSYSYNLNSVNDAHCNNTASGTVSVEVKPLPNVNFNFTGTCAATPIQLTADVTVNQLIAAPYQWFVNGSAAGTDATLTIVNGVAGTTKTVKLTVTGLNGCTNSVTKVVSSIACSQNTLTQGFYGSTNGKACPDNATAVTILTNWLSSKKVIGNSTSLAVLANGYNTTGKGNFTINVGEASTLNGIMPGGQTPNRINTTSSSLISYTTGTIPKNSGKISNVLITQTITMSVNLVRSSGLGNIIIEPAKYATVVKSATKCAIPASCSGGTITSNSMTGVSSAFATYINGHNIQFLYDLANDALGGGVLPAGISYGDINTAVDFYNKLFDGGVLFLGNFDTKQTSCGNVQPRGTNPDYVQVDVVKPETVKGIGVSAFPNPFTDKVRFTIQSQKTGKAILEVYNTLGQRVGVAFEGQLSAGEIRVVDFNASSAGQSNLYYILRMNDEQVTGKIMHAGHQER